MSTVGADMLRQIRDMIGWSQEQLARRSGVSVRTIRTLEGGGANAPRPGTISALVTALVPHTALAHSLPRAFSGAMTPSWSELDSRRVSPSEGAALDAELATLYDESVHQWRTLVASYRCVIDDAGRIVRDIAHQTKQPLLATTRQSCSVVSGIPSRPARRVDVVRTHGCTLARRLDLSDGTRSAFLFDVDVSPGLDPVALSYEFGPTSLEDLTEEELAMEGGPGSPSDGLIRSIASPGGVLVIDVEFTGRHPREIRPVQYVPGSRGATLGDPVRPNASGVVQTIIARSPILVAGYEWTW